MKQKRHSSQWPRRQKSQPKTWPKVTQAAAGEAKSALDSVGAGSEIEVNARLKVEQAAAGKAKAALDAARGGKVEAKAQPKVEEAAAGEA